MYSEVSKCGCEFLIFVLYVHVGGYVYYCFLEVNSLVGCILKFGEDFTAFIEGFWVFEEECCVITVQVDFFVGLSYFNSSDGWVGIDCNC